MESVHTNTAKQTQKSALYHKATKQIFFNQEFKIIDWDEKLILSEN